MKLSEIQSDALADLKKLPGWGIIKEIADTIKNQECNLDDVDEKLSAEEYKAQCIGRKIAKKMFTDIFDEVDIIEKKIIQSKKDYS